MENSTIEARKLHLIQWIISQDNPATLEKLAAQIDKLEQSLQDSARLVGYRSNGVRVLKSQLVESLKAAILEYESENHISMEELEKQSEQW